jgi:glutamyl/glutaminyl-tRNA synthetase
MNETMTRSQRTRKINSKLATLTKETKQELDQKLLDDLESDHLEELMSSAESLSEFDEDDMSEFETGGKSKSKAKLKKAIKKKDKKKRRTKKDKRSIMIKSKVNLKQMVNDMHRKGLSAREYAFDQIAAPKPSHNKCPKICKICFNKANYSCPRCRDFYCSEFCYQNHKEFVCAHIEYNYFY